MIGTKRQPKGQENNIKLNTVKETISLVAGVDIGSTETRVCLADKDDFVIFGDESRQREALDLLLNQYCIPSTYACVDDAKEIPPASNNLSDMLDSIIVLISNGAENPLLSRHRVLRGRKIKDTKGVAERYLDSATNKSDNAIFYTNIIDGLGYAIIQKYNGKVPEEVKIYLTISVRPKELNSKCKKKMTDNLLGTYIFNWLSLSIKINIAGLDFTTEPEAQINGTTVVYDVRADCGINKEESSKMADKLSDSDCFIHIEGGGSSIGVEVMRGGVLVDACSAMFPLGGNYMAQVFIDRYNELSGRRITVEAANNALITDTLRDGKNVLDVSELVADCYDNVAMHIVESLRHQVIDTAMDLTLNDVEFITLGGRLFSKDPAGHTIGEYITKYVQTISPNTEVYTLTENFIAQGNLVCGLNSEDMHLFEEVEEEQEQAEGTSSETGEVVEEFENQ